MPKLRNGKTDVEKFTQWIGRKCVNHNPLYELALSDREGLQNLHSKGYNEGDLKIIGDSKLVYAAKEKTYVIEVREVETEEERHVLSVARGVKIKA